MGTDQEGLRWQRRVVYQVDDQLDGARGRNPLPGIVAMGTASQVPEVLHISADGRRGLVGQEQHWLKDEGIERWRARASNAECTLPHGDARVLKKIKPHEPWAASGSEHRSHVEALSENALG